MDLGKIKKVIFIPDENPEEKPIPVENWPIKAPVKTPEKVPAEAD